MNVVFDFGGVLFRWRPPGTAARTLPQHVRMTRPRAQRWVHDFFQGYGGDWGDFDRGNVEAEAWPNASRHAPGWRSKRHAASSMPCRP